MLLLLALSLALQSTVDPDLPVSVDRIRARLAEPVAIQIALPEPAAEFRVVIREHPFWIEEPASPFKTPPMTPLIVPASPGSPDWFANRNAGGGGGGVDPSSLFAHIRHAVQERRARKEVEESMAEFCAVNSCR